MALRRSLFALGILTALRPQTAGAVHVTTFDYDLSVAANALGAGDILEIGEIPAESRIVDAKLVLTGAFAGTVDVGTLTGRYGVQDDARTLENSALFDDAAANVAFTRLSNPAALALPQRPTARGIGVLFSGAVASAAGKKVSLVLSYVQ